MKIIPDSNILSKKQWFSIFGANIAAGILWASHFVLEYSACVRNEIPIYFVIFAYIGCFVGGIFALKIASKIDHYFIYLIFI